MKTQFEDKLDRIADIWNYFIWEYKFCSKKIKFTSDVKTNYFGDILGYFQDTVEIVFSKETYSDYKDKFSFTISFLQAIYVQQDFVQEMLEIFKTGIDKGHLKKDLNYSINRDIRNELVGHPIRKFEDNLISSVLFSYQSKEDEIQYLRYHKDNNFKFESMTFKISDIQDRHRQFLENYFDIILAKLKDILDEYLIELDRVENVIKNKDFSTVLKLVELYFESFFKSDFIYDKDSVLKVYQRKDDHIRYQNFIDRFYADLSKSLQEKRASAKSVFEIKVKTQSFIETPLFDLDGLLSMPVDLSKKSSQQESYHYEIGKIATKRNPQDFDFFGGILRAKCKDNNLVLSELNNMEVNIFNDIEYYTSLRLICAELNED